jgi:hypothetical protein
MLDEIYESLDGNLQDPEPPFALDDDGRYLLNHLFIGTGWLIDAGERYPDLRSRFDAGEELDDDELFGLAGIAGAILQHMLRRRDLFAPQPEGPFQPDEVLLAMEQAFYSLILLTAETQDQRELAMTPSEFRGACAQPTVKQFMALGPEGDA